MRLRFAIGLCVCFATFSMAACTKEQPQPEPAAVAPSPPALTVTGYGPLRIGMSSDEAATATNGTLNVPVSTMADQCDYAAWSDAPRGMTVMFNGGTLVRIDVSEPGIPTPEGLEVGATLARADSVYGAVAIRSPHKYAEGEYLVVRPLAPADTIHRLVLEVTGGQVTAYRIGVFPAVEYVEGCS